MCIGKYTYKVSVKLHLSLMCSFSFLKLSLMAVENQFGSVSLNVNVLFPQQAEQHQDMFWIKKFTLLLPLISCYHTSAKTIE